ncbi:MAG: sensor histidine kinase, partial [Acetivibrio sp.]
IGLSICKTIVEAHNGSIYLKPQTKGAEFIFFLPKEEGNEF